MTLKTGALIVCAIWVITLLVILWRGEREYRRTYPDRKKRDWADLIFFTVILTIHEIQKTRNE